MPRQEPTRGTVLASLKLTMQTADEGSVGNHGRRERRPRPSASALRVDVRLRRIALGLEPPIPRSPYRRWTTEEDKLLGTDTDAAIAELLGRTLGSPQLRRGELGIRRR